jgi:hypothetical protein
MAEGRVLAHGLIVLDAAPLRIHGYLCAVDAAMERRRNTTRCAVDEAIRISRSTSRCGLPASSAKVFINVMMLLLSNVWLMGNASFRSCCKILGRRGHQSTFSKRLAPR